MAIVSKNVSPRQVAGLTAVSLAIPVALTIYLIENSWRFAMISFGVVLIGSYFLFHFMLQRFIYRKIKLIYKIISQTKATKKEEVYFKYILPQPSIDEVKKDVEEWAAESSKEIELLRKNEQFRREFLQNLSHEFKTPVFAIQGYVETLLNGGLNNPDINRKFLENTFRNVERLTNLVQDLDEISKLERGEIVITKQNFIIQELLFGVFDTLSLKAEKQSITFNIKKGCETPVTVFADPEKMKQVITNLFDNAIKYGKRGGNIVASVYRIEDNKVLVEISDDGAGIPERHLSRIFERFYRTEEGRSRDVTGSGLGLSIVKHIIEAHGQSIHVRSTEGVGTTIGFTLEAKKD